MIPMIRLVVRRTFLDQMVTGSELIARCWCLPGVALPVPNTVRDAEGRNRVASQRSVFPRPFFLWGRYMGPSMPFITSVGNAQPELPRKILHCTIYPESQNPISRNTSQGPPPDGDGAILLLRRPWRPERCRYPPNVSW